MGYFSELDIKEREARELLGIDEHELKLLREENANLRARLAQAEAGNPIKPSKADARDDFYGAVDYEQWLDRVDERFMREG